jgi:hypothetical protein
MGAGGRAALAVGAALAAALLLPFALGHPYWQTVDDPMMAMIVHGYGIAEAPSPGTFYLSVAYGRLLGALGTPWGFRAYDLMTYALLALAGAVSARFLWRAGAPTPLAAAALLAVFGPAALYPQFTVVAGLVALAGALVLATARTAPGAALAGALLVAGGMVRAAETALVLAVTAPFWLAPPLGAPRAGWWRTAAVLAGAALLLGASALYDQAFYAAPEWQPFMDMQPARMLFTDYGLRQYLMHDPLHAMRLGFVPNDLIMVEGWFFADPRIFPPARLLELTRFVSLPAWWWSNVQRLPEFAAPFANESFLAPLLLAACAVWRARTRAGWWSLAGFAVLMVALLVLGRPNTMRIYIPLLAGILLFALAARPAGATRSEAAVAVAVVLALAAALGVRNAGDRTEELDQRARLCNLPRDGLYVVWGERLAYEELYRPLSAQRDGCPLRLYPLAVHTYAPYALKTLRDATGEGDVIAVLLAGKDLDLIADYWQLHVLQRHLSIHYGRTLEALSPRGSGERGTWYRLHLMPPPVQSSVQTSPYSPW